MSVQQDVDEMLARLSPPAPIEAGCEMCKMRVFTIEPMKLGNIWRAVCGSCREKIGRKERERAAAERLSPIPSSFHWAELDGSLLTQRAPVWAIAKARTALLLPRVVLVGESGTGKTSLGCAMIRDRLDAGQDVAVALAWRLGSARAKHPLGEDEPTDVRRAMSCGLLLLDDMGSERNIPSNAVPDVVFERHAEGRPTWVTTWMSPEKMAERYGDGIARRVFEGAVVIDCGKERTEAQ